MLQHMQSVISSMHTGYAESIIEISAMPEQLAITQQMALPLQSSRVRQSRRIAIRLDENFADQLATSFKVGKLALKNY